MHVQVLGIWFFLSALGPSLADQQLDYAKEQYMAGVAAMEAKEFAAATKNFEEAYRYAPDKHAFNFNIGEAAWAAGDCMKARASYQRFLQLSPQHDEAATAKKRLKKTSACKTAASDEDTPDFGDTNREDDPDKLAIYGALQAARYTHALHASAVKHHGKGKPFSAATSHHRRHIKKLTRLILKRGFELPQDETGEIPLAGTRREVCAQALKQEDALISAYERAGERFAGQKEAKVIGRLIKNARRHPPRFRDCLNGG